MADEEEDPLENAISSISIHGNSIWWNEGRDSYRLANLSLWLDYLRSTAPEPEEPVEQNEQPNTATWNPATFQEVDYPEEYISDPEAWLRGHAWPTAIARNFPAISNALTTSPERPSLYQYSRVLDPQPRRRDPSLNANVPEFFPSVLLRNNDHPLPPPAYPPVADNSYQLDLFPYQEQNPESGGQLLIPQASVAGSSAEAFADWQNRINPCNFANLLLLQKAQKGLFQQGGPSRLGANQVPNQPGPSGVRHPVKIFIGPSPQQQLLLNSDFPELPNLRCNDLPQNRRQNNIPDMCAFAEKTPEEMSELTRWLETAYPQRAAGFADLMATANTLEEMTRNISLRRPLLEGTDQREQHTAYNMAAAQQPSEPCPDVILQTQIIEPRRLYRDVLASKAEDDSETALEGKYEELEREALEQYVSSENSGEVVEPAPETEDPFQDLERQAEEQYEDRSDVLLNRDRASFGASSEIPSNSAEHQANQPSDRASFGILSNSNGHQISQSLGQESFGTTSGIPLNSSGHQVHPDRISFGNVSDILPNSSSHQGNRLLDRVSFGTSPNIPSNSSDFQGNCPSDRVSFGNLLDIPDIPSNSSGRQGSRPPDRVSFGNLSDIPLNSSEYQGNHSTDRLSFGSLLDPSQLQINSSFGAISDVMSTSGGHQANRSMDEVIFQMDIPPPMPILITQDFPLAPLRNITTDRLMNFTYPPPLIRPPNPMSQNKKSKRNQKKNPDYFVQKRYPGFQRASGGGMEFQRLTFMPSSSGRRGKENIQQQPSMQQQPPFNMEGFHDQRNRDSSNDKNNFKHFFNKY